VGESDLVQETFLEAQRDFEHFHGHSQSELLAWLRQLLLHNLANLARHYRDTQKRDVGREVKLETGSPQSSNTLAARYPSPSAEAIANEAVAAVHQALERLPPDYRRVIALHYEQRLSFEEIGPLLQRSAYSARRLWTRAVERLRQELLTG
jgi:RNA polymerase sigma-70 factor (ECF subfamily)